MYLHSGAASSRDVGIKEELSGNEMQEKRRTKRQAGSSDAELWGVMEDDIMVSGQSCSDSPSPTSSLLYMTTLSAAAVSQKTEYSREQKILNSLNVVSLLKACVDGEKNVFLKTWVGGMWF